MASELLRLLVDLGNLAELNRLLSAYVRRPQKRLGPVELVELANNTAGTDYRYPNPEAALTVAVALALLRQSRPIVSLTEVGQLFLNSRNRGSFDLTQSQAVTLLGLFLDDQSFANLAVQVFAEFGRASTDELQSMTTPSAWTEAMQAVALVLQQLGVIRDEGGTLLIERSFERFLPRNILLQTSIDEETLWQRLEAQRLRAREAEEFVKREEQRRLKEAGRSDLAQLVVRVSATDVAAGYDIRSFDVDEVPRYIEVKSSIGRMIQFEWSVGERKFAEEHRDSYWIYFVPLSGSLQNRTLPVWMITDPLQHIRRRRLREIPASYSVSAPNTPPSRKRLRQSLGSRLSNWP